MAEQKDKRPRPAAKKSGAKKTTRKTQSSSEAASDAAPESALAADSINPAADGAADCEAIERAIRLRAYEIYLSRGRADGDPVTDWLEAERQVCGRRTHESSSADMSSSPPT